MWRRNCWRRSPRPCSATRSLSSRRPSAASACRPARRSSWTRSPSRFRVSRSTPTRRASASSASVSRVTSAASLRRSAEFNVCGASGSSASRLTVSWAGAAVSSRSASSASRSPSPSKPSGKGSSSADSVRGRPGESSATGPGTSLPVRSVSGRAPGSCWGTSGRSRSVASVPSVVGGREPGRSCGTSGNRVSSASGVMASWAADSEAADLAPGGREPTCTSVELGCAVTGRDGPTGPPETGGPAIWPEAPCGSPLPSLSGPVTVPSWSGPSVPSSSRAARYRSRRSSTRAGLPNPSGPSSRSFSIRAARSASVASGSASCWVLSRSRRS